MVLDRVRARSFRNIKEEEVFFSPGVNLLYGNNAEGKTNLLEAIYYFARGKSFRGGSDRELCSFGSDFFEIEASFQASGRKQSLFYRYTGKEKIKKRNGAPCDRAQDMIGHLRAVLFHPEHLLLVKGSPQLRRDFLNIAISQVNPLYIRYYTEYKRLLEERNSLLKFIQKGMYVEREEIEVYSLRLASVAAKITKIRQEYVDFLSPTAEEMMRELSCGKEILKLSYMSEGCSLSEEEIRKKYEGLLLSDIQREAAVGYTLFGPHHDDLSIQLSHHAAREYASQGQQRSITLALKVSEGEVCRRLSGEYPIFLFDDVMSELDEGRRRFLLSSLKERQIIITACDERDLSECGARIIRTVGGRYEALSE